MTRSLFYKQKSFTTKAAKAGQLLVFMVIFSGVAGLVLSSFVGWVASTIKVANHTAEREQAFQIAESGIDYYRWHLAHAPTDYTDGTATSGPYIHTFNDKDGKEIGAFSLKITAPTAGSSLVGVYATATVAGKRETERGIRVSMAKPSLAKYAVAANDVMRFGAGTEVFGPIHSNKGIRFDGLAHNLVTSSVTSYDDPDHSGSNEYAVHTHLTQTDPLPNTPLPSRTDVFETGRQFPVPPIDFNGLTADLASLKAMAQQSGGFYRASSGSRGYHVVLRTDDTFDLYRVTGLTSVPSNCTNVSNQAGWGTWSIQSQTSLGNFAFPTNHVMFFEDNLWIDGQVSTGRLTIVAGSLPDTDPANRKNITINNDLKYTAYDGTDALGLIAQNNINVGLVSDDDLHIDGALVAQNGRVGRYYYQTAGGGYNRCWPNSNRSTLTLFGMIGTNIRYGFAYTDGTGYAERNINYDAGFLYAPPPNFPLTSDQYATISWEEE